MEAENMKMGIFGNGKTILQSRHGQCRLPPEGSREAVNHSVRHEQQPKRNGPFRLSGPWENRMEKGLKMKNRISVIIATLSLIVFLPKGASAFDWGLRFGLHDMYVKKELSHTRGVLVGFLFEHETKSGYSFFGSIDVLVDNDKDELDPDHVSVWYMSTYYIKKQAKSWGKDSSLNWYLDGSARRNTVSSVEKTVKLMPGIKTEFNGKNAYGGIKLVAGYYMHEIDDDVPELYGYGREWLNNTTFGFSLGADGRIDLGKKFALYGAVQHWRDADEWLENFASFEVIYDSGALIKGSKIVFHAEYNEWNLDPYANMPLDDPDYVPVLPWNSDRFIRISIDIPFG